MSANSSPRVVTNGLILYADAINPRCYPGTGVTYSDLTGNNSGTLVGTMSYNFTTNAFDAQGATSTTATWLSMSNTIAFADTSQYTMEFAVKLRPNVYDLNMGQGTALLTLCGPGGTNPLVGISGKTASWQMFLRQSGSGPTAATYSYSATSTYNLSDNWGFLTMTVDTNRTTTFYLNGSIISTATPTPVATDLTFSRLAGGYSSGGNSFPLQGQMSFARAYNRVLSQDEITRNYQALKTRFGQ